MNDVVYLYGIVPVDAPAPPADLTGVSNATVELLQLGAAAAVVGRLPADVYRADLVESRLDDLAWVGEQGMAHERVVLWFVDHTDILPARLFSLYSDDAALLAALEPQRPGIARTFAALGGRREWNLKVAYDADLLGRHGSDISTELRRMDQEMASAPPGRRYLMERRRADMLGREVAAAAHRLARELLEALQRHAEDIRVLPLAGVDTGGTVVLSAALLVPRACEAALREEAESRERALGDIGMIISFSGPWAPYRFMDDAPNG
ncbi:MAG: GvpL/GvpF family gas vesicle protein [Gemmatimonadota bacterium]